MATLPADMAIAVGQAVLEPERPRALLEPLYLGNARPPALEIGSPTSDDGALGATFSDIAWEVSTLCGR